MNTTEAKIDAHLLNLALSPLKQLKMQKSNTIKYIWIHLDM